MRWKKPVSKLPYAMKILLENLLRLEDGNFVTADDIPDAVQLEPAPEQTARDRLHPRAGAAAGLHRCPPSPTWSPCATPSAPPTATPRSSTPAARRAGCGDGRVDPPEARSR